MQTWFEGAKPRAGFNRLQPQAQTVPGLSRHPPRRPQSACRKTSTKVLKTGVAHVAVPSCGRGCQGPAVTGRTNAPNPCPATVRRDQRGAHQNREDTKMGLSLVHSRALLGLEARPVQVEVHLANGLPSFTLVGLADTEVKEARERVRSAIANAGLDFPSNKRITVNLAPADLPKDSGRFDLPIALGILAASGQISGARLEGWEFAGELSLGGDLRPVRGSLAMSLALHRAAEQGGASLDAHPFGAAPRQRRRSGPGARSPGLPGQTPARCGGPVSARGQTRRSGPPDQPRHRRRWLAARVAHPRQPRTAIRRPGRCQRPGGGQARAGDRRRRRPQPA